MRNYGFHYCILAHLVITLFQTNFVVTSFKPPSIFRIILLSLSFYVYVTNLKSFEIHFCLHSSSFQLRVITMFMELRNKEALAI